MRGGGGNTAGTCVGGHLKPFGNKFIFSPFFLEGMCFLTEFGAYKKNLEILILALPADIS